MDVQAALDISREAVVVGLKIAAPALIAGLATAVIIGLLQSLTQIQEGTVAFVPKLLVMLLVLTFTLPWVISELVEYSRELIFTIPDRL